MKHTLIHAIGHPVTQNRICKVAQKHNKRVQEGSDICNTFLSDHQEISLTARKSQQLFARRQDFLDIVGAASN
ncbi:Hypothetical predicted protein [Podarcis lilfordi]|uniref:Uncharacterized protein n=1 Tax=Podarcis lilfordi TaxID=74358 RepID=A0AA35LN00_9SAUR|nr:Hypothetical predicted protein [Podarcis lilfordi]